MKSVNKPADIRFFIFAGEKSGDLLGANLISSLKSLLPNAQFYGVGGKLMEQAGLQCFLPMHAFEVMGISAVLKKLPTLILNFFKVKKKILETVPETVILIDYPGFNMLLAKALKKKGYRGKMVQYVCPSVWAWKKGRIKTLSQNVDLLLSILPFEKKYFSKEKLPVVYTGHPLIQVLSHHSYISFWKKDLGISKPLIGIFPGSRVSTIENNLPKQLETCLKLKEDGEVFHLAISVSEEKLQEKIQAILKKYPIEAILVPSQYRYELMKEARCAIATCGTVTLELGLHQTPTIVTYRLTTLNYFMGRYLFKILLPAYNLVNILLEETVFPEFIHKDLECDKMKEDLKRFFHDTLERKNVLEACKKLKNILLEKNGSQKAALTIYNFLTHEMPLS